MSRPAEKRLATPLDNTTARASEPAAARFRAATGGAPNHGASIPGIEHVISSNEAFHLKKLPKRIVIQGGGYIALEFAGIFAGFGSDVTVVYRGNNILRGFDENVRAPVRSEMEKQGITILTGCTVNKVDRHGEEFTTHLSNGSSIASDQVMFAIGRHPAVANLGLEKAGVAINPKNGGIAVDHFSKSSVDSICDRRRDPSLQPDAGRDP
jgi:glutathione reductase (NADPH)